MQIKPDEITSILKSRIEGLDQGQAELTEVGTVLSVADGIARIHGLENCMSFETLELPHGVTGLALNLESDNPGMRWDIELTRKTIGYRPQDGHPPVMLPANLHEDEQARATRLPPGTWFNETFTVVEP